MDVNIAAINYSVRDAAGAAAASPSSEVTVELFVTSSSGAPVTKDLALRLRDTLGDIGARLYSTDLADVAGAGRPFAGLARYLLGFGSGGHAAAAANAAANAAAEHQPAAEALERRGDPGARPPDADAGGSREDLSNFFDFSILQRRNM